jgi:molecular chaperone DnaJ
MAKDYYKILGVEKNATKEEIKKAYKQLAKKYHPDLNRDEGAAERFKEINEAAAVLADDEKRRQYDQFGTTAEHFGGFGGAGFDFEDLMGRFGFDFDSIFDSFFGGGLFGRRRKRTRRGADVRYDMEITLEEAAKGTARTLEIPVFALCVNCEGSGADSPGDLLECPECSGSGVIRRTQRTPFGLFSTQGPCRRCKGEGKYIKKKCSSCGGEGRIEKKRKIELKIPAGAETGTNLRITGAGESGERGAEPGDLYVIIHVKKHKLFARDGDDLHITIPVSFVTAALGGKIDVPTLDGSATLKIPAGTQPGAVFRMRGKGIPYLHGSGAGDEFVTINVEIPNKLTKKQKELLMQFEKSGRKGLFF